MFAIRRLEIYSGAVYDNKMPFYFWCDSKIYKSLDFLKEEVMNG